MGITGLIPFLEKASSKVHLKDLRGSTVAVDTYCWLHKGVFSCAEKLARGEDTDQYIQYCLKYVKMLLSYDIKPILVFDGGHLPAKALTEKRRRESRQQSKKRAAELLRLGRVEEARSHMRRCVDVTHEMALRLICECRRRNVDCIVAPYEADAQMAWFNKVDLVQYIITEDSDLTLFGARNVIFKLDLTGAGLLVESDKLYLAMGCRREKYNFEKFLRMCILSGCDYLDSLPGIGLVKACKFVLKTEENDMWKALKKIPQYLNMRNLEVDDEYIENFHKAEATFRHMYIYNPLKRKMERLHELQEFDTEVRHCCNAGTIIEEKEKAFQLALGNVNPFTLKQLDNWHPDRDFALAEALQKNVKRAKHKSIWHSNFEAHKIKNTDDTKLAPCALYFKKVDFISGTIEEDINANIQEENRKPGEVDIFSMYRNEFEECKSQSKRKRQSSSSSCSSNESSPVVPRIRHNPFAKVATFEEDQVDTSPPICENRSLLKILSPKKNLESFERHAAHLNKSKHALFVENVASKTEPLPSVEVRSRFFASNVKKVCKINEKQSRDLANTIDEIESLSQQTQCKQLHLYHQSPPGKKNDFCPKSQDEMTSSHADSGIESISTDKFTEELVENMQCNELSPNLIELNCIQSLEVEETTKTKTNDNCQGTDRFESISISDDEDNSKPKVKTKPLILKTFSQSLGPRLGLSKPKNNISKNNTKIRNSIAVLSQNQTRLSMFGFQKKPSLK